MTKKVSILVVEDEAIVALDIATKLERLGYTVAGTAATGEAAIELVHRQPPALVLMDIQLGTRMDGIAAAAIIQREHDLPVLFLTAHSDQATLERTRAVATFGYILKPFDERDLRTQIEMALFKHDADRRLRESHARLEAFTAASFEGIVESADGRIVDCNAQLGGLLGYTVEELRGRDIASLVAPEDRERVLANIAANATSAIEHTMLRKDGARLIVEAHGRALTPDGQRRHTAIRDITGRKRAEAAVQASEAKARALIQHAPTAIYEVAFDGSRFLSVNDVVCEWTGYTREELLALDPRTLTDEAGRASLRDRMLRKLNGSGVDEQLELTMLGKDGRRRIVLLTMGVFTVKDGQPASVQVIAHDITNRRRREEELRRLNRTLHALNASNKALLQAQDAAAYLADVCRIIVEDCGYLMVWIGFAEDDAEKTVRPVASAGFEAGYLETLQITWGDGERGRGPTGTAIRTGQPAACRNMLTDPAFAPWRAEALQRGYAASLVLPLLAEGRAFGAVSIYAREADPFTAAETAALTDLVNDVAAGVQMLRARAARQQAEAALQESEARFRAMFERHHAIKLVIEPETGAIVDANAAATLFYGYSHEQLCRMRLAELNQLPPDLVAAEQRRAEREQRHYFVFPHRLASGEVRWVEMYAAPVESRGRTLQFAILHDITDRKRAEAAVRESELKFFTLFDKAFFAVALSKWPAGTLADVNEAFVRTFGFTKEEALGRTTHELGIQPDAARLAAVRETLQRDGAVCDLELVLYNKRGEARTFLTNVTLLEFGGQAYSLTAVQDITDRKLAEEAVRHAKEEWERTFNTVPDLIAILDNEHHIVRANRAMAARLGTTPENCVGLCCHEHVHGAARPPVLCPHVLTMQDGREHTAEVHEARLGGDFLVTTTPLLDEHGASMGAVHVARDITERKRAEEALRASEAQFRLLFEANPNPMWVFDEETLKFLAVNDSVLRLYGYTREEFLSLSVLDIRPPEERASVAEVIAAQQGVREAHLGVFRHLKKDGTPLEVEIVASSIPFSGRPGRLVLVNDITARLAGERTLRMQSAALDAAVNSILITDTAGRIQWVNSAFTRLSGYTLDEVRGRNPSLLKSGAQPGRFYSHLWATILSGEPWQGELINRHKDGQHYPEQMTITPFRAGAGEAITHFIAIKENITERRLAEESIQRINAQLEQRVQERTARLSAALELSRAEQAARRETQSALEEQMRLVEAFLAHSLTPLVFLDRDCNFVRVNAAYARACGREVGDFPGHNHFEFYPHAENQRIFAEVVRTGQPFSAVAKPFTFPDHPEWGTTYWDWTLVPLCDGAGVVRHLVFSLENVSERKRAEDRLQLFQRDLRELTTKLLLTEERERKQLAMVLHDSIGQMLALIRIKLGMLEKRLRNADALAEAGTIKQLAEESIRQVRGLTTELSPPLLYKLGLAAALQDVGEQLQKNFGVEFHFEDQGCPEKLDETLRILLYQSGRELLANIGKHAQARHVRLTLAADAATLRLVIADDGVGFDLEAVRAKAHTAKSFGFFSVGERMHHVGGTMEVQAAPGHGATITLSVPLQSAVK